MLTTFRSRTAATRGIASLVLPVTLLLAFGGCPAPAPLDGDPFPGQADTPADDPQPETPADPADDPSGDPPTDVQGTLARLGVDTTPTARVDQQDESLPDDYSPLGASCSVAQTDELFLLGPQLLDPVPAGTGGALPNRAALLELSDDATGDVGVGIVRLIEPGTAWETDTASGHPGANGIGAQTTRTAAAADLDRDGHEEIVIARFERASDPNAFSEVFLTIVDQPGTDRNAVDFAQPERRVLARRNLRDIALAIGDFDGDGTDDVILGLATGTSAELQPLTLDENGVFTAPDDSAIELVQRDTTGSISIEMAAGNLDRDNGAELAVVVNESFAGLRCRYWIFDDAVRGHAPLAAEQAIRVEQISTYEAVSADVAIGDLDGDAVGEIVLAGLTDLSTGTCGTTEHVYLALEDAADAERPLAPIGEQVYDYNYVPTGVGCDEVGHLLKVRHVFVNTLDIDGDGLDEVQVNLRIFDDWTAGPFREIHTLPDDETLQLDQGRRIGGVFSRATVDMATGDVNGDGRDDVISYAQWRGEVSVWGLDGPSLESATFRRIVTVPTQRVNSQARIYPVLVPANMDSDGLALKYDEGEYRLVFTEPIIIAALAAAPCVDGIDQNYDACRTGYGLATAQSAGLDGTVTIRTSTWVGGETKIFGIGARTQETITTAASFSAGRSYQLEQTVEYTTGPREDTIICTVLPVDQYSYKVVSHPDPTLVGETVVINMPRTPVTLQVERTFYNESLADGAFRVGRNVFLHTPGQIDTYPTEADADALIDTGGLGHIGPAGELVDAVGAALGPIAERLLGRGLKSDRTIGVGASGGESSIEIRFSEETDYRAGAEIGYEVSAEATAGLVVGGSIGGSIEAGLSWGNSTSTIYRGTVGDIAPADFGANSYSYGLFTYVYNYGDRTSPQFEVINYWVE